MRSTTLEGKTGTGVLLEKFDQAKGKRETKERGRLLRAHLLGTKLEDRPGEEKNRNNKLQTPFRSVCPPQHTSRGQLRGSHFIPLSSQSHPH
jgi:hypothetical protein